MGLSGKKSTAAYNSNGRTFIFPGAPMKPSRSEFITVRGLRTHVRHWGREGAPIIFMVHGWMDVGASFQFVADSLAGDWHVIAPDWRGFGLTERAQRRYLLVPRLHRRPRRHARPLFAGPGGQPARPQHGRQRGRHLRRRAARARAPADQPGRLRHAGHQPGEGAAPLRQVARRVARAGRCCAPTRAWRRSPRACRRPIRACRTSAPPSWRRTGRRRTTPANGKSSATRPTRSRARSCTGSRKSWRAGARSPRRCCGSRPTTPTCGNGWGRSRRRASRSTAAWAHLKNVQTHMMADAGHMLHHDQPEQLARMIETFLAK